MTDTPTEKCPRCGDHVFATDTLCMHCGAELHLPAPGHSPVSETETEEQPAATPTRRKPQYWRTAGSLKPLGALVGLWGAWDLWAWLVSAVRHTPIPMVMGRSSMDAAFPWQTANSQAQPGTMEWYIILGLGVGLLTAGLLMWARAMDEPV